MKFFKGLMTVIGISTILLTFRAFFTGEIVIGSARYMNQGTTTLLLSESPVAFVCAAVFYCAFSFLFLYVANDKYFENLGVKIKKLCNKK